MRLAIAACAAGLLFVSSANASRKPTSVERASLQQAVFDVLPKVAAPSALKGTLRLSYLVSTRGARFPSGAKFYYRTFASVSVFNPRVGGAVMLFGYYIGSVSGWRLLSGPGSESVGCDVSETIFHGYKQTVLKDLHLACP
jgi:hypothetical protein